MSHGSHRSYHAYGITITAEEIHDWACEKGFWDIEVKHGGYRNNGEMIALMHSELSELLEAYREPGLSEKIPNFTQAEEEAADVLIRLLDFSVGRDIRLKEAVIAKMHYNEGRPYKHGKEF